jgi:hypothetical protein
MTPLSVVDSSWIFLLSPIDWSIPITSRLTPPQPRCPDSLPQAKGVKPHSVPCEESNCRKKKRKGAKHLIGLPPSLAPKGNAEEPHEAKKILVDDQVQVARKE